MSEIERLQNRLEKMVVEGGLKNMSFTWGTGAAVLSAEERAAEVNKALDELEAWDAKSLEERMKIDIKSVYDTLKSAIKLCQFDLRDEKFYSNMEGNKRLSQLFGMLEECIMLLGNYARYEK